jgi:glycosyltransferase involved in cell wall biosynthesis
MDGTVMRADLHVHSKHSSRPSQWVLQKLGCPESFIDPLALYRIARARGMELVTVTDHNTLAGSLDIAHLDGTFVSEEITAYFPEDRCKLHVLALNITERQHGDITRLRENVFDLAAYLHAESILAVVAHPLYAVNDKLTLEHFERMLLLFRNFELNGARDDVLNRILTRVLGGLTRADIELLADKHGIAPLGDQPWIKHLTAGSDDHSGLNIACAHTEVKDAAGVEDFLKGVAEGRASARVRPSTPKTLAHNLYSIAYQFYRSKFKLDRYVRKDKLLRLIDRMLMPEPESERDGVFVRLHDLIGTSRLFGGIGRSDSVQDLLVREGRRIMAADPSIGRAANNRSKPARSEEDWFGLIRQVSDRVLSHTVDAVFKDVSRASLFNIFHAMGATGSLYTLLAPYFVAFREFTKDRQFGRVCLNRFRRGIEQMPQRLKVAHFTDTFQEVNGVAGALKTEAAIAREQHKQLTILTCAPDRDGQVGQEGVKSFTPIGSFGISEYPELNLSYPPFLEIVDYCFDQEFTTIHAATPGPVGLCALAVGKILNLPVHGTYHTAFPEYVGELTGDVTMTELVRRYMAWFYNHMDAVYVPSKVTGDDVAAMGVSRERIKVYPRGVDIERFNPSKRNGFLKSRYGVCSPRTLLYVGRISREKNLDVLRETVAGLCGQGRSVHLVVVGDGPYLEEFRMGCSGLPVTFTGYLQGDDLDRAYASSDVFLFPSTTDTFGNVVLEAQASGLATVVTDRGGPKENVVHGQTGFVVEPNAEAFVAAVSQLDENPHMLLRMQENARAAMVGRSVEAAFLKTWELFRRDSGLQAAG